MAQATAPFLDSTNAAAVEEMHFCRVAWHSIKRPDRARLQKPLFFTMAQRAAACSIGPAVGNGL
jgi:hypothetical protein